METKVLLRKRDILRLRPHDRLLLLYRARRTPVTITLSWTYERNCFKKTYALNHLPIFSVKTVWTFV